MTPVEQARNGVASVIVALQRAKTANEREEIARLVACIMPSGCRSLSEMAQEALAVVKEPAGG